VEHDERHRVQIEIPARTVVKVVLLIIVAYAAVRLLGVSPIIVDYLMVTDDETLPTGAIAWYDQLTPGTYQLSVQRRFTCCDGPTVESNQISFEVVK